jgi:hypothetical protein
MKCLSIALLVSVGAVIALSPGAPAQEKPVEPKVENKPTAVPDREVLFKKLEETLSGVKLVGKFTVLGKEDGALAKEEYTITSAKKMEVGDYWLLTARIKYGKNDLTVPLPLEIKWAGDTPVITLTDFTIPALGTFSSRVVIYDNTYAGTWSHGKVGGHLFGTIEKVKVEPKEDEKPAEKK